MRSLLAASAVLLAVVTTTAGCSAAPTPLCDAAATQLQAGRVGAATELSARAVQAQEGDCATRGLSAASERYAAAYSEVAAGAAAEAAGDPTGATGHYRAAQQLDVGNPVAIEGLTRLGVQATTVDTPVTVTPAPVVEQRGVGWPWLVGGALLFLLLLGALAYAGWEVRRRLTGAVEDLRRRVDDDGLATRVDALASDHDAALAEVRGYVDDLETDQLRLLGLVLDRTREHGPLPDDGSLTLLSWPDRSRAYERPEDEDAPPDRLDLAVVSTRADPAADGPRLAVHQYRVEAARLDLAAILATDGALRALADLADDPDDTDRLAALESTAQDVRRWRTVEATPAGPIPAPVAEQRFWVDLHATVVLTWSRSTATRRRERDVCTLARPGTAAALVDVPAIVDGLAKPQGAALADLVRPALERALVHAICDEDPPRVEPAEPGSLVVVTAAGLRSRTIDVALAGEDPARSEPADTAAD
ncbi:hypothetical protein GCM10023201_20060 [Actinomycetospora corticicola]|uniref:Uncharacterized protein n=1 Tax=Actinomycetospora corticicola TaxID=663602 RepID=A0A7Y9DS49_9PSEU|nr:hypothetical protein [Actinomycetospora corticicola]NYD34458.1 hypothetical protein [Actinomycetospora corticicola]